MHDPFPSVWADVIARLPRPVPVVLHPEPNTDAEHLTCFICDRGDYRSQHPPEWTVTHQTGGSTVTRGLHEACRLRHAMSRYSKGPALPVDEEPEVKPEAPPLDRVSYEHGRERGLRDAEYAIQALQAEAEATR